MCLLITLPIIREGGGVQRDGRERKGRGTKRNYRKRRSDRNGKDKG